MFKIIIISLVVALSVFGCMRYWGSAQDYMIQRKPVILIER